MPGFLLLFDVGNTNIKVGVADSEGLRASYAFPTDLAWTADLLGLRLLDVCRHAGVAPADVSGCVAASVVPTMDPRLRQACRRYVGREVLFAPDDLPLPLENRYERPQEVGADRLVTAWAATVLLDAPSAIVVDFGTATTFDCVESGAYLGGLICPGVLSSAGALAARTAKLPQISLELDSDAPVIGRSTSESLNQGLLFGFAAMAEGVCARLRPLFKGDVQVAATGGFAEVIARITGVFDHVRPDLLLDGLRLLYERNGKIEEPTARHARRRAPRSEGIPPRPEPKE